MTPTATTTTHDFKVKDLSLWQFGRKEIELAEHEMPGLMALRAEYGIHFVQKPYTTAELERALRAAAGVEAPATPLARPG